MKSIYLFFCLLKVSAVYSQFSEIEQSKMYYEKKSEVAHVTVVDSDIKISLEIDERRVFNEMVAPNYATEFVYSRSFSEIEGLTASISFLQKNGKYASHKVDNIIEKSEFTGDIFYGEDTYYEIAFPNVEKGCYTEVSYEMEVTDPHFFKPCFFSEYYPVKEAVYTIVADSSIEFGWSVFGEQKDEVVFEKKPDGNKYIYSWILKNSKAVKVEKNDPGYMKVATHVVVYIKKYRVGNESKTVLSSLDDLFNWYQELIGKIKPVSNEKLVNLTQQIIAGSTSETEKAERIFAWVQSNIRYIAFEDGWRGFIPFPASEICEKRYGDCKDMSHLMFEMMQIAGLDVAHAWVGTRSLYYRYEDTPCPNVDNHMITCLKLDGKTYLLDATDPYTPFGIPSTFILSKQVLFKGGNGSYELIQVPEYEPEFCTIQTEVVLNANGIHVSGNATKTIETFEYSHFNNIYHNSGTGKKDYLTDYLELGQNNFNLISSEIRETKPRAETTIQYTFEIPGYIRDLGESSFINLNLTTPLTEDMIKADRAYNYELEFKTSQKSRVTFEIPEGYEVPELPVDISKDFAVGSFSATYRPVGKTVIYERIIAINRLVITPSEFGEWNNFIKALHDIYTTTIELKKR
ncbi:MAG: DUF3858 domain-containing protein [Bacteroidetes bacterium]|nr:DUF3858 domain-containing protein [Bacteroidota bacterium]